MFEKVGTKEWEDVPWDEWQDPFKPLVPVAGSAAIHEPEPGLLDEEILPLEADWLKGPK